MENLGLEGHFLFFSLTCEKAQQESRGSLLFHCGFRPWNNGGTVTSGRDHEPQNYLDSQSRCREYVVDIKQGVNRACWGASRFFYSTLFILFWCACMHAHVRIPPKPSWRFPKHLAQETQLGQSQRNPWMDLEADWALLVHASAGPIPKTPKC